MKYFRWTPDIILNMSWDNYTMYLTSIPSSDIDEANEDAAGGGEVDMFNLYD